MGVQVYGMAVAVLDDDLKITKLEIFYGEPAQHLCLCTSLQFIGCSYSGPLCC